MKRGLSLAAAVVGVALAVAGPAWAQEDLAETLMTIEKGFWQGWADADGAPFAAHLTDGAIVITPGGMTAGKAQQVEEIEAGACEVRSWELSSPEVHRVTDDVMILTYHAEQEASCEGEDISGPMIASAVYVNQGGEWKSASYQETPDFSGEGEGGSGE